MSWLPWMILAIGLGLVGWCVSELGHCLRWCRRSLLSGGIGGRPQGWLIRWLSLDDLFTAITPRLQELQNPNDVHFNAAGYDFLGAQVAAAIRTALPATAAK